MCVCVCVCVCTLVAFVCVISVCVGICMCVFMCVHDLCSMLFHSGGRPGCVRCMQPSSTWCCCSSLAAPWQLCLQALPPHALQEGSGDTFVLFPGRWGELQCYDTYVHVHVAVIIISMWAYCCIDLYNICHGRKLQTKKMTGTCMIS